MDHGFAPGVTPFDLQYRNLLANRKTAAFDTTCYPPPAKLRMVEDLWRHLLATAQRPIGNVVLVSHGNQTGDMALKIAKMGFDRTTYDDLMRIQGDPATAVNSKLPEELRKTPPSGPLQPIKIHIRGCRVGEDQKFMKKLQDVLGDKVAVTAPRHLAMLGALLAGKRHVIDPPSHGWVEGLMYDFEVSVKTRFKSTERAKLVKAFRDAKHKFIDGTTVPDALWEKWVPTKSFNAPESPIEIPPLALGAVIQSTNPAVTLPKLNTMWSDGNFQSYPFEQSVVIALATKPPASKHRELILNELRKSQLFSRADHPFHEQLRFPSLEAFVDSLSWAPTWSDKNKTLTLVGTRIYYGAQIHLCDPTIGDKTKPETWQLIYNFYPRRDLPLNAIERMSESDARLFFTAVP